MAPTILETLHAHAAERGDAVSIVSDQQTLTYAELDLSIASWAERLPGKTPGLLMDNSADWIIIDLAARSRGATCIPLPVFFSDSQIGSIIDRAAIDCLITDQPERANALLPEDAERLWVSPDSTLHVFTVPLRAAAHPAPETAKITFTSGSTGTPKGVCLQADALDNVARSLRDAVEATPADQMVSLLPLSTLLENIAVYAGLMAGGKIYLPPLQQTGVSMSGLDVEKLCQTLSISQPSVIVTVPEILQALIYGALSGWRAPESLRFIAVGGAPVSSVLLEQAAQLGLPVFQGYGLSEAASVVCLNTRQANRPGSVGRPLPHCQIALDEDGEVRVKGPNLFSGYLGHDGNQPDWLATGDLGFFDDDGYLYLRGRKKNLLVTSFGRNISPEWVESELMAEPEILRAVVFGEGQPFLVVLLTPLPGTARDAIGTAVAHANSRLPDYARVEDFFVLEQPLSSDTGELTPNGRPRRSRIEERFQTQIHKLYRGNL